MLISVTQSVYAQDEARAQAVLLYNEAQELAGNNQFDDAIDAYRQTLELANQNQLDDIVELIEERLPRVYASRASNAYRTYQSSRTLASVNDALDYFKESQEVATEFNNPEIRQQAQMAIPQLYYVRSILNYRQDNLEAAMSDLDNAINLNPNYAAAYYQKGIVQKQMTPDDVDGFMRWYDMAIEVASRVNDNRTLQNAQEGAHDELIYRAVNLADERRFADAIELLQRVEDYDDASDEAQYRLAEIYNMRSNWSSAESSARRALQLHTGGVADKAKIYFELGTALKGQGNFTAACSAFENARYGNFTEPANHELQFELKCEGHAP
tara:strand:+ start:8726 stop:9703 length:978 start_codon:yes stop_codon:yes gene_type:complete